MFDICNHFMSASYQKMSSYQMFCLAILPTLINAANQYHIKKLIQLSNQLK